MLTKIDLTELNNILQTYILQSGHYIIQVQSLYGELIARQFFVIIHLLFFLYAFALILRKDWKIFTYKKIDLDEIKQTSNTLILLLFGLWISGICLIYMNLGFDIDKIKASPEIMAKIFVVVCLTTNVFILHGLVFPGLRNNSNLKGRGSTLITASNAINTVSWTYAALIIMAGMIVPTITFYTYLEWYSIFLVWGIMVSLFTIHPIVKQHLIARFHQTYVLR